ncbi:MAG: hypothetical protein COY74_05230 [Nitrosopumilales archaeon CG_4_10_14_0_8_um_filter_34_8]|nr:MAG: hypothetical protein COY74_05230 [Nitrosopumilales archaeon CG_4_10_14_0_8_um_filter_34_8]PJB97930.1 MAG: hypothetical protein CO079_04790 [Nitrosopumilales archaeon CG_4_9_14_0_8_um_filter_34_10]
MNFIKPIILGSIVLSVIVLVIYFGFNTKDIPTQDNPDSINSELIKWSDGILFNVFVDPKDIVNVNGKQIPIKATFQLKPNLSDTYSEIGVYDEKNKPLLIIPVYTASAYAKNGFYDFYNGNCNTCLTTKIVPNDELGEQSSANAVKVLELLGYDSITDIELDTNPTILSKYDKIIVLHNEYVTKKMFDAITSHPNVIYLYPNALYAEISTNFVDNTISLIRGHGYPDASIDNGFDWKYDNTRPYEFDKECNNWEFYEIPNGKMLNCYPEQKIWKDEKFLKTLKEL